MSSEDVERLVSKFEKIIAEAGACGADEAFAFDELEAKTNRKLNREQRREILASANVMSYQVGLIKLYRLAPKGVFERATPAAKDVKKIIDALSNL